MVTRRDFVWAGGAAALTSSGAVNAADTQPLPDVSNGGIFWPRILVSHAGYRPESAKFVVIGNIQGAAKFDVLKMGKKGFDADFSAPLQPAGPDLGEYQIGDFSRLSDPGVYRVRVAARHGIVKARGTVDVWSHNFLIAPEVWDPVIAKMLHYFRVQRCGPSREGYNTPCHMGSIRRSDGGPAKPVPGGWHAAHDHQRSAEETLLGVCGLAALASARPDLDERLKILEELRWGNDYFLSIQNADGSLATGVKATNYFDSSSDWWEPKSFTLFTEPAETYLQYMFVATQAAIWLHYRSRDPEYSRLCLEAGRRSFAWVQNHSAVPGTEPSAANLRDSGWSFSHKVPAALGAGALAATGLYRATGEKAYREAAAVLATQLAASQKADFWPTHEFTAGYIVLGLCTAVQHLGPDPRASLWLQALERFASEYVSHFSHANAFGILPSFFFETGVHPGSRSWKDRYVRYFCDTDRFMVKEGWNWQTGNLANVASLGVGLLHTAVVLGKPELRSAAQRQIDWALGVNPFDASYILGVGRNNPPTYPSKDFIPPLPDIDGAGLQGPVGDDGDQPMWVPGFYAVSEYWLPHHSWMLWLIGELSALDA